MPVQDRDGRAPQAVIFDVFGTLVDWRSGVAAALEQALAARGVAADPLALADAWRGEYDPSMAPIREGRRPYLPLDELHRENLVRVLDRHGLGGLFDAEETARLARAWEALPPWPDVRQGLAAIRRLAIAAPCSNGSIALMVHLARHAGLVWDCILGADIARSYKPDPRVYLAACAALRLAPAQVMMVAAHNADLAAARAVGLMTGFIPRPAEHGPGGRQEAAPDAGWDIVAPDLPALARRLAALPRG